jgi:hypothetical protein
MERFVKIENATGLVRDMTSGAIINTNRSAKEAFLKKQQAQIELKEQVQQNAEKIDKIESDVSEIKQMLMLLINKDK